MGKVNMDIKRALEILRNKNDYIVPTSDMDEAIEVAIKELENKDKVLLEITLEEDDGNCFKININKVRECGLTEVLINRISLAMIDKINEVGEE